MAYASWSVIFGEVPTAAKWNILGTNDASFNDGTGIGTAVVNSTSLKEAFFRGRKQENTTDSQPTGLTVQFGWGYMVGTGTDDMGETVTFPTAFSAAPPLVLTGYLSARTTASGAPDTIDDFNASISADSIATSSVNITTTNFGVRFNRSDAATFANTNNWGYSWLAIGAV